MSFPRTQRRLFYCGSGSAALVELGALYLRDVPTAAIALVMLIVWPLLEAQRRRDEARRP